MSIVLSEQDLDAVARGVPFRFIAPKTNVEFVVVRADVYDRAKGIFVSDDIDPEAMYPHIADMTPEDWEDPSVYGINNKP